MSKFLLDILMATLPELVYKRVYSAERDLSENRSNSYYSEYIEKLREERKTYRQLKDFAGESGWILLDDFNDAKNSVKFTLACMSYRQGFQDAMLCFALSGKEEEYLRKINTSSGTIHSLLRMFFGGKV